MFSRWLPALAVVMIVTQRLKPKIREESIPPKTVLRRYDLGLGYVVFSVDQSLTSK